MGEETATKVAAMLEVSCPSCKEGEHGAHTETYVVRRLCLCDHASHRVRRVRTPHVGEVVVYLGDATDEQVKFGGGNADPRGVLTPGEGYEVEYVSVHRWHTKVWLKWKAPGPYNSVHFDVVSGIMVGGAMVGGSDG